MRQVRSTHVGSCCCVWAVHFKNEVRQDIYLSLNTSNFVSHVLHNGCLHLICVIVMSISALLMGGRIADLTVVVVTIHLCQGSCLHLYALVSFSFNLVYVSHPKNDI